MSSFPVPKSDGEQHPFAADLSSVSVSLFISFPFAAAVSPAVAHPSRLAPP